MALKFGFYLNHSHMYIRIYTCVIATTHRALKYLFSVADWRIVLAKVVGVVG